MMVEPGRKEQHLLAVRRVDDLARVRCDARSPGKHAQVWGLQVSKQIIVALDGHNRLVRLDPVSVVERAHAQAAPITRAEPQDRQRLVHSAQHRIVALEDLHAHHGVVAVALENLPRAVEVGIGVIPLAHLLDGQVEYLRPQSRA